LAGYAVAIALPLNHLLIILKGMQLYNFIFLARSWASDRVQLASHLSSLGKRAEEEDNPLCFILYPEGTLVSKNTRPISKKFADKIGIVSPSLLPRKHYIQTVLFVVRPEERSTSEVNWLTL